jgi:dolichol-phosphate mannosyltransferase
MPGSRTIIIIPTYNEADNIARLIAEIRKLYSEIDILVVDDHSPDGTGSIAVALAQKSDRIHVLQRTKKEGLGRAYIHAFQYVLSLPVRYDYIVQMDADFSHDPADIAHLLSVVRTADVAVGSRYSSGGSIPSWGVARRCLSSGANFVVRSCIGSHVRDWTSGFRCFRRNVLENISIETIRSKGYLFMIVVLNRCIRRGFRVNEVPITFIERGCGRTKLGFQEVLEALVGIVCLVKENYAYRKYGRVYKGI